MPYLKSAVVDLGLPDFINHLIPLVEANLQTPVANTLTSGTMTTGTINPGVIWVGNTFQVGVEALIPINRQSGTNVGVIAQLHFFLDDIDPRGIGKPIFGNAVQPANPLFKELIMRRSSLAGNPAAAAPARDAARPPRMPCSTMPSRVSATRSRQRRVR